MELERLKNSEVRKIVGLLNSKVIPDVEANLARRLLRIKDRGYDTGPATTKRLRELQRDLKEQLDGGYFVLRDSATKDLHRLAAAEASWVQSTVRGLSPIELGFDLPAPNLLRSIVSSRPFEGQLLKDWFSGLSTAARTRYTSAIGIGLVRGEGIDDIVARITGASETARRNVESVIRTAVNHVSTQAREITYKENDDLIKGVQIVATLDERTTPVCRSLDGKVYEPNEGPRPPFHFQCRTTTVPVLRSWKELGLPFKEVPESTRASLDGQVSEKLTYGKWLRGQPTSVQDTILGPTRAKLFRSNQVSIERFVDDRGRQLTLEELERRSR